MGNNNDKKSDIIHVDIRDETYKMLLLNFLFTKYYEQSYVAFDMEKYSNNNILYVSNMKIKNIK